MPADQIAQRYAQAWLAAAKDKNAYPAAAGDCESLQAMLAQSADFRAFLVSPLVAKSDQEKTVSALAGKAGFHDTTRSLLLLLAANRRLAHLAGIVEAAKDMIDAEAGESRATVTSAVALDDRKIADIQAAIAKQTGRQVTIDTKVDPELIGGLVIKVGSTLIDDSVKTKLDRLQRRLQSGAAAA